MRFPTLVFYQHGNRVCSEVHNGPLTETLSWHFKLLATKLFMQQLFGDSKKERIEAQYYWPYVRGIP